MLLLTVWVRTALRGDTEETPLQLKLNSLAELIAKLGSAAGLILFSALSTFSLPPSSENANGELLFQ